MFRSSEAKKARILLEAPEKAKAKAERKQIAEVARKNYEATSGLPDRKTTFHIPGAPAVVPSSLDTYTGVDVRKAVYDSHREAERIIVEKVSKTQQKKSPLKNFHNYKHEVPKVQPVGNGEGRGRERPLKNMKVFPGNPNHPPGKEFPLSNKDKQDQTRGPARVIIQPTKKDRFDFKGVVSHDQSRLPNTPGYNDHFKVKAKLKNLIWD
ncbi:hypothetical protein BDN70DRAFT_862784 [Pholiota conissans]|uniref:Uncharacterized protein n=1 Tax=Pholiota conissans TaxID=109636 RepID=A0A9P5YX34_9AGAR|nr:hypothetical protein BDN70DRAFT_862784 [Pholiota conissans]